MLIGVSEEQELKHPSSINVTVVGSLMCVMLVHPENAYSPKVVSFEGSEIGESKEQFWKQRFGIVVIPSGMLTVVSDVQP